jgi:hypothetical protein
VARARACVYALLGAALQGEARRFFDGYFEPGAAPAAPARELLLRWADAFLRAVPAPSKDRPAVAQRQALVRLCGQLRGAGAPPGPGAPGAELRFRARGAAPGCRAAVRLHGAAAAAAEAARAWAGAWAGAGAGAGAAAAEAAAEAGALHRALVTAAGALDRL